MRLKEGQVYCGSQLEGTAYHGGRTRRQLVTSPLVGKQEGMNAGARLAFPFPLVWDPSPGDGTTHIHGGSSHFN